MKENHQSEALIATATSGESNPGDLKETVRVPYLYKF